MTAVLKLDIEFDGARVRVVGTDDIPEFVAADACAILDIVKTGATFADFPADEKGSCSVTTLGGSQEMLTVTEPGLYRLIMRSRKPEAERFRRWIFHELLPSIRRYGTWPPPAEGLVPFNRNEQAMQVLGELQRGHVQVIGKLTTIDERTVRIEGRVERLEIGQKDSQVTQAEILQRVRGGRKDLTEPTKLAHRLFIKNHFDYKCPNCKRVIIVDDRGEKVGEAEYDHFERRDLNEFRDTWMLCFGCHLEKTRRRRANEHEKKAFAYYQQLAKDFSFSVPTTPSKKPPTVTGDQLFLY